MIEKKAHNGLDSRSLEIRHPAQTGLQSPLCVNQERLVGLRAGPNGPVRFFVL